MTRYWILGAMAGLSAGCWSYATSHCANNEGDASCGGGMFCSRCEAENNGCVSAMPTQSDEQGACYTPTVDMEDAGEAESSSSGDADSTGDGVDTTDGEDTVSVGDDDDDDDDATDGMTTTGTAEGGGCVDDDDCADGAAPFCNGAGACVACDGMPDGDAACEQADAGAPVCSEGVCVQCTADAAGACGGDTPVCGVDNSCRGCVEHFECPESACHLDGGDAGACFDEGDVVMANSAGALVAAVSGVGGGDDLVVVLSGGVDYNQTVNATADAEIALLGPSSAELTGTTGLPSLNVAGNAIVYVAGPSIASGDTGVDCSGTSVWLDDSEVRNNAQVGLDISGGCAAHLRRTVVRSNSGGGIDQVGGELRMTNTAIALNGGTLSPFGGISLDGVDVVASYSTIAGNDSQNSGMSMRCSGMNSGSVRNSIIVGADEASIDPCNGVSFSGNAVDEMFLPGNTFVGAVDGGWFLDALSGDFHLTASGETEFMDIAQWEDGDPIADVDGDPIPTEMPSFPGYDQP